MLELFLSLYLQAAILLGGGATVTTDQTGKSQTTISQPNGPVNSSARPISTTTTIGGGGWDDKN